VELRFARNDTLAKRPFFYKIFSMAKSTMYFILISLFLVLSFPANAQGKLKIDRIDPPSWWANMQYNQVQLMVYGENLSDASISINSPDILIQKVHNPANGKYLFVDIFIKPGAPAKTYNISFENSKKAKMVCPFELMLRNTDSSNFSKLDANDVVYLLMPDRFSNGDPSNDTKPGMLEVSDRQNPNGRHGGDIAGIARHLGYIKDMGFTALWITPLLENNMQAYSYHGYAITDFYKVDPRFGSNIDYKNLVASAHKNGLKVIMDMVINHCGTNNRFIVDLPDSGWIHHWAKFTRSNYRGEVNSDPYASEFDKTQMEKGWFDLTMADLNQDNPFVYKYLLQNSIWWVEFAGIDGIRMDTYPYPQKNAMAEWCKTILGLYPNLWAVGETWLRQPSHTAWWQGQTKNYNGFNSFLPSVTDFPTYYALKGALNQEEGWVEGLSQLYNVLSQDYLYANPKNLLIFADNHDLSRFYTDIGEDFNKFRMGMAYILTTRGIPQVYYGTEILMTGNEKQGHGYIRKDFPGGWENDTVNAFTSFGLSKQQIEAQTYLKKLLNWRKTAPVVYTGKFKHFIPEDGVYVYFRYNDTTAVMIVINKNNNEIRLGTERFMEVISPYNAAKDIINNKIVTDLKNITLEPASPLILELMKQ
jgi:glycosidase